MVMDNRLPPNLWRKLTRWQLEDCHFYQLGKRLMRQWQEQSKTRIPFWSKTAVPGPLCINLTYQLTERIPLLVEHV